MYNRDHLVLRTDAHKAFQLSDKYVFRHWSKLYGAPAQSYPGSEQTPEAKVMAQGIVAGWRLRATDLGMVRAQLQPTPRPARRSKW